MQLKKFLFKLAMCSLAVGTPCCFGFFQSSFNQTFAMEEINEVFKEASNSNLRYLASHLYHLNNYLNKEKYSYAHSNAAWANERLYSVIEDITKQNREVFYTKGMYEFCLKYVEAILNNPKYLYYTEGEGARRFSGITRQKANLSSEQDVQQKDEQPGIAGDVVIKIPDKILEECYVDALKHGDMLQDLTEGLVIYYNYIDLVKKVMFNVKKVLVKLINGADYTKDGLEEGLYDISGELNPESMSADAARVDAAFKVYVKKKKKAAEREREKKKKEEEELKKKAAKETSNDNDFKGVAPVDDFSSSSVSKNSFDLDDQSEQEDGLEYIYSVEVQDRVKPREGHNIGDYVIWDGVHYRYKGTNKDGHDYLWDDKGYIVKVDGNVFDLVKREEAKKYDLYDKVKNQYYTVAKDDSGKILDVDGNLAIDGAISGIADDIFVKNSEKKQDVKPKSLDDLLDSIPEDDYSFNVSLLENGSENKIVSIVENLLALMKKIHSIRMGKAASANAVVQIVPVSPFLVQRLAQINDVDVDELMAAMQKEGLVADVNTVIALTIVDFKERNVTLHGVNSVKKYMHIKGIPEDMFKSFEAELFTNGLLDYRPADAQQAAFEVAPVDKQGGGNPSEKEVVKNTFYVLTPDDLQNMMTELKKTKLGQELIKQLGEAFVSYAAKKMVEHDGKFSAGRTLKFDKDFSKSLNRYLKNALAKLPRLVDLIVQANQENGFDEIVVRSAALQFIMDNDLLGSLVSIRRDILDKFDKYLHDNYKSQETKMKVSKVKIKDVNAVKKELEELAASDEEVKMFIDKYKSADWFNEEIKFYLADDDDDDLVGFLYEAQENFEGFYDSFSEKGKQLDDLLSDVSKRKVFDKFYTSQILPLLNSDSEIKEAELLNLWNKCVDEENGVAEKIKEQVERVEEQFEKEFPNNLRKLWGKLKSAKSELGYDNYNRIIAYMLNGRTDSNLDLKELKHFANNLVKANKIVEDLVEELSDSKVCDINSLSYEEAANVIIEYFFNQNKLGKFFVGRVKNSQKKGINDNDVSELEQEFNELDESEELDESDESDESDELDESDD